jgi:predicted esterase
MGGAAALVYSCRYCDEVSDCFIYAGFLPGERFQEFMDPSALGQRPDRFGGISAAKHVKFTVAHCDGDPIVPVESGREIVAKLAEHGIGAKTLFFEAQSHGFVPDARTAIQSWITGK